MPSTATTRNRFEKQGTGENTNTWGSKLNATAFDLIDTALDGRSAFTLSGTKTLSSTNFAADESRARVLDITSGTGGTVTIPSVEKTYFVRNGTSGTVIITTGGGTTASIATGLIQWIMCDGTNVRVDGSAAAAATSAAAAAASAASINDSNLVHLTGTETIAGAKTFSSAIVASAGVTINGNTLDGLSAIGVSVTEAANAAAVRSAISAAASGAVTASGLTMASARLLGRSTASTGAPEEISVGSGLTLSGGSLSTTTTTTVTIIGTDQALTASVSNLFSISIAAGKYYRVTVKGLWKASATTVTLVVGLNASSGVGHAGHVDIYSGTGVGAVGRYALGADGSGSAGGGGAGSNAGATNTPYPFEIDAIVRGVAGGTSNVQVNSNGTGTVTVLAGATLIVEQLN